MDITHFTYVAAYNHPADGNEDHSIDLLPGHPAETDPAGWYPEEADADGVEAADRSLERLRLRRTSAWTWSTDLGGVDGWYARVAPIEPD